MRAAVGFILISLSFSAAGTQEQLDKDLEALARRLPIAMDKYQTFTAITRHENTIRFRLTTDMKQILIDSAALQGVSSPEEMARIQIAEQGGDGQWMNSYAEMVKPVLVRSLCTNPSTMSLLNLGYTYQASFYAPTGTFLYTVSADLASCANL